MRAKKKTKRGFNWLVKLNALVRRKRPLTDNEQYDLETKAGSWPTCACGQLCQALPRISHSATPLDKTLQRLGLSFYSRIQHSRWSDALVAFRKIEKRSAKLLKEMAVTA
jgi:hypothetical protein